MSDASELGRQLAALRKQKAGKCAVCGAEFVGTGKRRYCSHNCTQKAYLARKQRAGQSEDKGKAAM